MKKSKKEVKEKKQKKSKKTSSKNLKKISAKDFPTLKFIKDKDIALDFATKVYKKFNKMVKSVILFGSTIKETKTKGSDIDIMIIIDDASIQWDQELVAWYREELGKIIQINPYKKELHVNTVRLSTWWGDLLKGDPTILNIIRYGEALIDFGGFFEPLKILLAKGKIKQTPEAIFTLLQRAPMHLARSKASILSGVEGLYWAVVDSAHAALIAAKQTPPSPEHIPVLLKNVFVDKKLLKMKYVIWYRDIYVLHRKILHGQINSIEGKEIDDWDGKVDEFIRIMAGLVKKFSISEIRE